MKDKTLHYLHATVFCRHTLGEESRSQSSKHQLHFQMSALEQNTPKKLEHTMLTLAHADPLRRFRDVQLKKQTAHLAAATEEAKA